MRLFCFFLCNHMTNERQRGSHEIVQSRAQVYEHLHYSYHFNL